MNLCENNFYVYALIDPINRVPFYIGKGKGDRLHTHLKGHANYNTYKLNRIKYIRMLGFEPYAIKLVDNLDECFALELERELIIDLKFSVNLTNYLVQPPSRAGKKLSEDHKRILREKNIGKKLTEEHKRKIGLANSRKTFNY